VESGESGESGKAEKTGVRGESGTILLYLINYFMKIKSKINNHTKIPGSFFN
jgi:hypothetical protein